MPLNHFYRILMISQTIRWLLNLLWSRMRIFTSYPKFIDLHNCQYWMDSLKNVFHLKHCIIDLWPCIWQHLITWPLFSMGGRGWHYTIPGPRANKKNYPHEMAHPSKNKTTPIWNGHPSQKYSTPQMKCTLTKDPSPPPPKENGYPPEEKTIPK